MTEMLSEEKRERLLQMDSTMWAVIELIKKRRPDLYPSDGDVSHIMGMINRVWKPGATEEEVYAEVVPQLEVKVDRMIKDELKDGRWLVCREEFAAMVRALDRVRARMECEDDPEQVCQPIERLEDEMASCLLTIAVRTTDPPEDAMVSDKCIELCRLSEVVVGLVRKRRPDLWSRPDEDVLRLMSAVGRVWKPGMDDEEVYAKVVEELEARSARDVPM